MEYVNFIFSSFWTWIGTVVLALVVTGGLASLCRSIFTRLTFQMVAPQFEASITKAVSAALKESER